MIIKLEKATNGFVLTEDLDRWDLGEKLFIGETLDEVFARITELFTPKRKVNVSTKYNAVPKKSVGRPAKKFNRMEDEGEWE